jgi:hypothetical protein
MKSRTEASPVPAANAVSGEGEGGTGAIASGSPDVADGISGSLPILLLGASILLGGMVLANLYVVLTIFD